MTTGSADALAALRDIHLPQAVSFWPLAPGWWVVLALSLASLVAAGLLWRRRRRSPRRVALGLLAEVEERFRADGDAKRLAVALSNLLRRVALLRFPRPDVASLHGDARLGFLSASSRRADFPAEVVHSLERCLYGPATAEDAAAGQAWIDAAGRWIRRIT
jgi:hypothetical protein